MSPHSRSWDEAAPAGTDNISSGDDEIRNTKIDIRERLAVDHIYGGNTALDGYHTAIHLSGTQSPSVVNGYNIIYALTNASGGIVDLYCLGTGILQITKSNYLNLDGSRLSNNVWLIGANSAGSGNINMWRVSTSDIVCASTSVYGATTGQASSYDLELATVGFVKAKFPVDLASSGTDIVTGTLRTSLGGTGQTLFLSGTASIATDTTGTVIFSNSFTNTGYCAVATQDDSTVGQQSAIYIVAKAQGSMVITSGQATTSTINWLAVGTAL